jgi:acetylglutamate kinase
MDSAGQLITDITAKEAKGLIEDGTISGGMIPKIETCIQAVKGDVEGAVVIDGRVEHALLIEVFTEGGVGTLIKPD